MGDHKSPGPIMQEGKNGGRGEKEKGSGYFGIWDRGELECRRSNPWTSYDRVCEEGYRLMALWVREKEQAPENRRRKGEAEKTEKVQVPSVYCRKLETFPGSVAWTASRTPEAAPAACQEA